MRIGLSDHAALRAELAALARRRDCQIVPRSSAMPCDWRPTTLIDPRFGMYFSYPGAWDFIAELLEQDYPVEEVQLEKPPGTMAFVMLYESNVNSIYIKIHLGMSKVIGRSFHAPYYSGLSVSRLTNA